MAALTPTPFATAEGMKSTQMKAVTVSQRRGRLPLANKAEASSCHCERTSPGAEFAWSDRRLLPECEHYHSHVLLLAQMRILRCDR